MRFPERAKADLVAEGVGKGDAGESLAEGFGHERIIVESGMSVKAESL
jgi:hypothetical protein